MGEAGWGRFNRKPFGIRLMPSAAYRRVQQLWNLRPAKVVAARTVAVLHSLLALALLGVSGLLLALILSRGIVRVDAEDLGRVPPWLRTQLPIDLNHDVVFRDTGLYPLLANNSDPQGPWAHRAGANLVRGLLTEVRPLRTNLAALALLLALGLGLLLLLTVLGLIRKGLAASLASEASAALRRQIHRQMYRLGQSALPTEGTGPVVNLFTREVNEVRDGLFIDLDRTWRLPILAVGLLAVALLISLRLTVFLASLGALVGLISRAMNHRASREYDLAVRETATQLALLHEDLAMLRTVRVYGMEGVDKQRFDEHLERYRRADEARLQSADQRNPMTILLYGASAVIALGLLGFVVLEGRLSPTAAVVLTAALLGLARPLDAWLSRRETLRQAARSAEAIYEYLELRPELQQRVGALFLAPLKDRISFENVTIEDSMGRPLLSGVSAEIPAGSRTAILSLDEESKHAMVCLIPRLIDPKVGRVRMDGIDLREATLESLRAQVAIVLQNDLIISDTVLANIGLSDPSYTLPRIIEAAKLAHVHHFVRDLPQGYDTIIGPLGHYLNADEQYRIALARAFLHDPSIVIIEEPDVALDDDIKHLIDDTIDRLAPGRTLIFLPHRLSTIRRCDQVIVLNAGRVDAVGPPREVHGQSKLYRHIQYVEFNQFATGEVEAGQMGG
jgi:ABC-type multidrug transport system fused ATPase/permease subunit